MSVQDLKPSSQDISAFYLANIYQILSDPNGSQVFIPPTLPNPSTPFSPPPSAVWVNSLWFLSLAISLTCALLATLMQQWARRYMKLIQTRYSPHKRARIRAYFAEGVDKLRLPWAVEALPVMLHLSLFLFFAGLAVFLFNINHTVFKVAISWVGFCTAMYLCITFMPMFRHDSPYYAPLSSSAWYFCTGIRFILFRILWWIANRCNLRYSIRRRAHNLKWTYCQRILRGMEKEFEETALRAPSEIDGRALMWTYESLDEDHELEQFFAGIPGFCSSKVVDNPQSSLDSLGSRPVAWALNRFLERTWSSNLVPKTIKIRRLVICVRAIDAAHLSGAAYIILHVFFQHQPALFRSAELGHSLISWGNNDDRKNTLFAQGIIACIIANVPQRNERWFSLTMHHLGISEHVLRGYLENGDSVLLANLIHFTRHFVRSFLKANWEETLLTHILWRLGSDYNVQDILPGLKHDFCDLWNEIVLQRRGRDNHLLLKIFVKIRPIYVALHQGSIQYDQYHLCSNPSHRVDSASSLNEVDDDSTAERASAPIASSSAPHHHDAVPSDIPPVTDYNPATSRMSNLDDAIPHLVDEQSRNGLLDNTTPVSSSFHLAFLKNDQISDGTAIDSMQGTTDSPSHGTASRPARNMTTATPSFVLDTVPSPIPLLVVSPDTASPCIYADPTVNQSGSTPAGGSVSLSLSQNFTPSPFALQVFDSKATQETGPLDTPDDTLDPNRRVMSQTLTHLFPDLTTDSPRLEDHDKSENHA